MQRLGSVIVGPRASETAIQDAWAIALQLPAGSVVSGVTALALRCDPQCNSILALTAQTGVALPYLAVIPSERRCTIPSVRIIRRDRIASGGPRHWSNLPICSALNALGDLMSILPREQARNLVDHALNQRWCDESALEKLARERSGRGRRGAAQLRAMASSARDGTHSAAERRLASLLRRHHIEGWITNHTIRSGRNGRRAVLDFAWPSLRLAVEVDGRAFHVGRASFESDRSRQNAVVLSGWLVLRFTWEQITRAPNRVVAEIRAGRGDARSATRSLEATLRSA